jgi:2-polyprenyl-3-methyl-5-hydroxy-6-metoxy-1,4-benzoquinol methylase
LFAKRSIKPELLDHASPAEAEANLHDLVKLNEKFGGHAAIRRMIEPVLPGAERFSLLDVGAASGDTARLLARMYPKASIVSLDCNPTNLAAAPQPKLIGDAFLLPFRPSSFDYVLCSLFLHHFQDDQVTELLRSFYRLARSGLFVCDLERHVLPFLFLPLTGFLFRWNPITLHDGPISVRASFRPTELARLAEHAGIHHPKVAVYRPAFRICLSANKL